MQKQKLIYQSTARKILGLSRLKFKRLGITPVTYVPNFHFSIAPICPLYDREEILGLIGTKQVETVRTARKKKDWSTEFSKKYGRKERAFPDVTEALLSLNVYAKYHLRSKKSKDKIYSLKSKFLKILYQEGLVTNLYLLKLDIPEKVCSDCKGIGVFENQDYPDKPEDCVICIGTGIRTKAFTELLYVFEFHIKTKKYRLHQPYDKVDYISEDIKTYEMDNMQTESEATVTKYKLTAYKALVDWYIMKSDS